MTSRLYVRKGGAVGAASIELTSFTGRKGVPFFDGNTPLIQLGMRFSNGQASQGTFKLTDPAAELPRSDFNFNLPIHTLVTWTEDAPGAEIWLSRGRVDRYEGGRGDVTVDNEVEYDATVDDGNNELRLQAFTVAWPRPEETDTARLYALQGYTLNGTGSTATNHRDTCEVTVSDSHRCPDTNTVTMPAKTYPVGTQPQDVVQDCADTAGKVYGVTIDHTGGSHLCLQYILETDHTTNLSPISISDHINEWDPTNLTAPVYEPHWAAGKASLYEGKDQPLSGMVSIYGTDQSVYVSNSNATPYDYAVESYYDAESVTPAQAAAKASGLLLYKSLTTVTHRVSIKMLATQLDLVGSGMSLQIKAAAAIAGELLDTWQTRRIAECLFEPMYDGRYWAHLQLDRTPHGPRKGAAQPAATVPHGPGVPPGPPIAGTGCTPVYIPPFWIEGVSGSWSQMEYAFLDGAVEMTAPQGEDDIVEGIAYQTEGSMFPPLVEGDGELSGTVTLPELDDDVLGAEIQIWLSGDVAGGFIQQSQGIGVGDPFDVEQVTYEARTIGGTSSRAEYTTPPLFGMYRYKIRRADSSLTFKLWPADSAEPAAWEGPGNAATIGEFDVRFVVKAYPRPVGTHPFSQDFTWHFSRPIWCADTGVPASYYYIWTAPMFSGTANGSDVTFFLQSLPAGGVLAVMAYINGNYEPIESFDPVARSFTFASPPESGDKIDAAWIPTP